MQGVHLVGFYDPDPERSQTICNTHECRCFAGLEQLLDETDAVTVAAPTSTHLEIGERCLKRGIHVLMEKPLAHNVEGARRLVALASETQRVLMVGHVERYNPAVGRLMELLSQESEPILSIDARRLSPFDGSRCIDVDVLHDLLIHDIDLALEIARAPVETVSAVGRPVFSHQTDVAHTRIVFAGGPTAVLWTGKCSPRKVRTMVVTTPRRYLEVDTLARTLMVCTADQIPDLAGGACFMTGIRDEAIPVPDEEPLWREMEDFVRAVKEGGKPLVHAQRALEALEVLELVSRSIASGGEVVRAEAR
jgi:predicted dehydrogenase